VDAELQDAASQPTTEDDAEHGWRSWFGRGRAQATGDDQAGQDAESDDDQPDELAVSAFGAASAAGAEPAIGGTAAAGGRAELVEPGRRRSLRTRQRSFPLINRPHLSRRLATDPRIRVWFIRCVICAVAFSVVTIVKDWRYGVTAAVICAAIDTGLRSRTTVITPPSVRVTSAQRSTARRLKMLQAAGYMALNTRTIPGTETVIDHVVIGPSGIFTLDSQRLDKRLSVLVKGGGLYHGPVSQEKKIDHAKDEAERAAALISAELGQTVKVRPAMVIYGPKVPWVVMKLNGVDLFDGAHISTYFRRRSKATAGHHWDSAQVALVVTAAAHVLPPLG
jgi:Nuclease-related domain